MKVSIIINRNPFFENSASANRLLTLINGLVEKKVSLKLLITGSYQNQDERQKFGTHFQSGTLEIKYLTKTVLDGIWKRRFHKYVGSYLQFKSTSKKLKKELENFKGIVWVENDLQLWKIISSISNRSFKLFSEMSEFLDIHQYNKGNALQRKLGDAKQKYFENTYIHQLDGFALMTKTLMKHYEGFKNHPPLLHLPMTVDLERFKKKIDSPKEFKKPYIAFVGVMDDAKDGVNILIESFAKVANQFPEINLYLVGGWNYDTPSHQAKIIELKLEKRIFWMGEFKRDAIPSIITNAEILVLPRPDSKQAQGGFPTKLGEYLATGNPVCATRVGEIPNYLVNGESVFFAEPGSVDSFAAALQLALKNKEEAQIIGENGKNVAEKHFNKENQAITLYKFFEKIISKN